MRMAEDLRRGVERWCASDTQGLENLERFLDQNAAAVAEDGAARVLAGHVREAIADARERYPDRPNDAMHWARTRLSTLLAQ